MKEDNVLQEKSYAFALRVVKTHRFLSAEKHEFTLSKQFLRAGTSIGANIEEAIGGFSEKDFAWKLGIAYKEARESHFWVRLLRDSEYLTAKQADSLLSDIDELLRILGSILKTLRAKDTTTPQS